MDKKLFLNHLDLTWGEQLDPINKYKLDNTMRSQKIPDLVGEKEKGFDDLSIV